jgi:hypothetical protein
MYMHNMYMFLFALVVLALSEKWLLKSFPKSCIPSWRGMPKGSNDSNRWLQIVARQEWQEGRPFPGRMVNAMHPTVADVTGSLAADCTAKLRTEGYIARMYIHSLGASTNAGCRNVAPGDCYLRIPKTGSSQMKHLLGIVNTSEVPCTRVIVPVRDPVSRFLSGVVTVYARSQALLKAQGARACQQPYATATYPCVWRPLTTHAEFEQYSLWLLDLVEDGLKRCEIGATLHIVEKLNAQCGRRGLHPMQV